MYNVETFIAQTTTAGLSLQSSSSGGIGTDSVGFGWRWEKAIRGQGGDVEEVCRNRRRQLRTMKPIQSSNTYLCRGSVYLIKNPQH